MKQKPSAGIEEILEQLSPLERKIIPFLSSPLKTIEKKAGLDTTSVLRALRFLEAKGLVKLETSTETIIELGTNGIYYKKHHLPERVVISVLEAHNHLSLEEAQRLAKLSENEFKVSLGVLKSKALVSLSNGKLSLIANKEEIIRKTFEEQLIDALPLEKDNLSPELLFALDNLKKRKDIIEIKTRTIPSFTITELGKKVAGSELKVDLLEEVTPEIIKNWTRSKKFRKYDLQTAVPRIQGGKQHFVNQSIVYARKIWTDLGFKEMKGTMVDTAFWVFDALFTPQDHPAREMQDTFFLKDMHGQVIENKIAALVKQAHETGIPGSTGWGISWDEKEATRVLLRTHTTSLSARTLAKLKSEDLPAKYFAIGKAFRNETVDWNHGFEFYQTEGIVIDEKAHFRHLLGYLQEFYKKMGFKKIKFVPSFFSYTEPSVEIQVFHPEKKIWLELGGAGIFRPEVTAPLFGKPIPVLAWGQGFDRIIMDYHDIKDLRKMYANDLKDLREKRFWLR
ncbi:phenylalanine--tRNA ligase subunit alpha [Candidatus Pacearchaeota archaeon]|nr:phenylalanine--tRNA ligase subunit alpha [Candidatus Pacearchaeota archaeon]